MAYPDQTFDARNARRKASDQGLLLISYKFVKAFDDNFFITCFSNWNLNDMPQHFLCNEAKFQPDPTKDKEFPHRPPL